METRRLGLAVITAGLSRYIGAGWPGRRCSLQTRREHLRAVGRCKEDGGRVITDITRVKRTLILGTATLGAVVCGLAWSGVPSPHAVPTGVKPSTAQRSPLPIHPPDQARCFAIIYGVPACP
jgi:hypothetical protein